MTLPCCQQQQGGHLAGGVYWTGEEDDWQETDYDYEDSLKPWTSEWYGTDGQDDEAYPEETDWTEDFCETDDYDPNDKHLLRSLSCTVGPNCRNTRRRYEQI